MKRRLFIFILIGLTFFLPGCRNIKENNTEQNKQIEEELIKGREVEKIDETKEFIDKMTIDEKIGQLMIIGLNSTKIDQHTVDMIKNNKIGGFILFKYNIDNEVQTLELLNSLKEANSSNPLPLFISIDEEGGKVNRLPSSFLKLPEAKKVGDINDEKVSLEYGKILGKRIKSLGFNMDYAPVLDVNSNPKNPVIGNRAFGSTIDTVIHNGLQVMKGINSEGVISIVKHFPGHGDTSVDSHIDIPVVNKGLNELEKLELAPFIQGIEEDVDGIMIGHIIFPELDKDSPASISKEIINNLLREKLSYEGVAISDDMTMGAIIKNYTIEEASIKFLKGGGDIVLVCHGYENQLKVINRIKEEVAKGSITEEELDEKIYRIIKLKEKYNLEDKPIEDINIELINSAVQKFLDNINRGH